MHPLELRRRVRSPIANTHHWSSPIGVEVVVMGRDSSSIGTWWNALDRSMVDHIARLPIGSRIPSMIGRQ
jgi:hypothetical protein